MSLMLSLDLRVRVVSYYSSGIHSYADVGRVFQLDPTTVSRWVQAEREGRLEHRRSDTRSSHMWEELHLTYLKALLRDKPSLYLREIQAQMESDLSGLVLYPRLSKTTIWRLMRNELG